MADEKTSSDDTQDRAPVLDDFALPFPDSDTPTRRRQPRKKSKRSTRTATPPERSGDVGAEVPPDARPAPAESSQEATAPLPVASPRTPSPDADVSRPSVVAKPGPRLYKLSNPVSDAYLQALNDICNADDGHDVRVIADKAITDNPPSAGDTPQAQGLRRVLEEVATLADETSDMGRVRASIDEMLAPLDRTAARIAESQAARQAASEVTGTETARVAATPEAPSPHSVLTTAAGPSGVEGLPAEYDDGVQWLRNGLLRHPTGVWIGLVAGWTGIWIALWGAALGLVFGALAAAGYTSSLGAIGIGQAASAIGIPVGAFLGAVGGFVAVVRFLIVDHPIQAVISVASGAVLGVAIVVGIAAFERLSLSMRGYRRLSRAEARRVAPLVKQASVAMHLTALPRFAMDDHVILNAWTHMRTVVLTKGLLTLDDAELRAVIAHELEHWRAGDGVGLRFVWAATWPVALTYNLGMLMAGNTQQGNQPRRGVVLGVLALLGWVIAWPAAVIIKLLIVPVVSSSQRRYEYSADAAAARIGYAGSLSSALRQMAVWESGRTGWEQAMAATHPPTELRLEALEPSKPDDFEYQEDELGPPSKHELRRLLTFWSRPAR
jgi:Zn-dependent protease with chaperone function